MNNMAFSLDFTIMKERMLTVFIKFSCDILEVDSIDMQELSLNKINKAYAMLEQQFERPPVADELASALEIPEDKVKDTMSVSGRHVSVDAPLKEDEDFSLLDLISNNESPSADGELMRESLQREIERSLETLTERERDVIRLFFGIGMNHGLTLEEIGDKFDLTRERVRQIKEKAIRRLRQNSRSRLLKMYLGD